MALKTCWGTMCATPKAMLDSTMATLGRAER